MVNGIHFDLTAKIQTTNGTASFEHGEFYPAIIAGLWVGKTEWQGKMSDGFAFRSCTHFPPDLFQPQTAKTLKDQIGPHAVKTAAHLCHVAGEASCSHH